MIKKVFLTFLLTLILTLAAFSLLIKSARSWSNGGYSNNPDKPDYGTHDWIAEHALHWLPPGEKQYILDNLVAYLYGTELPDNNQGSDGISDTRLHHIYFGSKGDVKDDAAAVRAVAEFNNTLIELESKDFKNAAKNAGIMTHYIADMAVFGHVMGLGTDWGAETHHSDYEDYVNRRTSSYISDFDTFLIFDGNWTKISAYEAAMFLAYDTTFDQQGKGLTAVWMDRNYNWSSSVFWKRVGESLNLAANYITDVLHTLYVEVETDVSPPATPPSPPTFPPIEIPLWTVGAAIITIALIAVLALARVRPKKPKPKLIRVAQTGFLLFCDQSLTIPRGLRAQ